MNNIKKLADNKEFWNVKKAGEKLLWRLAPDKTGQHKAFKPNENDFNALKSILGMINRIEENNIANNVLFAKLYLNFLTQEIRYHETTVFNEDIFSIVNAKLNFSLESYYAAFINDLHGNQFNKILIDEGEKDQLKTVKMAQEFKEKHTPDFCIPRLNKAMNNALLTYS
jgi:hypothetical protein